MIHELKDTALIEKVGGKFKLAALIQRRLLELIQGSRPLIDNIQGLTPIEIVVREIMQDKIAADESGISDTPEAPTL